MRFVSGVLFKKVLDSESTSSLLLPSDPSLSIAMASLSAIPEGPSSSLPPSLRYDNSNHQEERRAWHTHSAGIISGTGVQVQQWTKPVNTLSYLATHRISTSSMTSSSTARSIAYSGDIKPPLIVRQSKPPLRPTTHLQRRQAKERRAG